MDRKTNLIVILTDQFSSLLLDDESPCPLENLNRLKADSLSFSRYYTCSPICSPARGSIMTGLYPHTHGMVDLTNAVPKYRADFDASREMLSSLLRDNGYHCGYFGKWHIERSYDLGSYGFEEYLTERELPMFSHKITERVVIEQEGYEPLTLAALYSDVENEGEEAYLCSKALDFAQRHKKEPFALFVSTYAPHDPYLGEEGIVRRLCQEKIRLPGSFYDDIFADKPNLYKRLRQVWEQLDEEEVRKVIACYYAYAHELDLQIGRLIDGLKSMGLYEDSVIIFTTDHGDAMGAHGCFNKNAIPMEEVYRIPLLIKAPSIVPGETPLPVSCVDLAPTLANLMKLPGFSRAIDGESILGLLDRETETPRTLMAEYHGLRYGYSQRIVWWDRFKYVFNTFDFDECYDLEKDPQELNNLVNVPEYQDTIKGLCRKMWEKEDASGDNTMMQAQYFPHRLAPVGPKCANEAAGVTGQFIKKI